MTEAPGWYSWLYAVVPAGAGATPAAGPGGVAGEPPRLVAAGALGAVVGSVPSADFDAEALERRLRDPRWLEDAVRAHHRVVEEVCAAGRGLPLRFATVYRDDDRVRALLAAHAPAFLAALARIADRTEWGVKAYLDARAAEPEPDADARTAGGGPEDRPGTAYLLRRRAARDSGARALEEAAERARRIHGALAAAAGESAEHPPQSPEAAGVRDPMVLNGAYLVDRGREAAFGRLVAELGSAHRPLLRVELTGPWPPYSFVDLPAAVGPG
ncbi:GvpL/GvpF family gas vesicle protein [Streptomyces sp. TLI_171]|uniref:GvpL/GvpF family gas vesicle protein n=1 Tax=Streptomyces sp. TLI_171 TaxID=1938859 RepID=UPI000C1A5EC0|nr:GvpL/GvpF family gas vesicle protein [Streptomyces sp. TLI_171]RKE17527.1 gas vesicle protein GvpL/GvpF [Streptomyces sp. TLI_171]